MLSPLNVGRYRAQKNRKSHIATAKIDTKIRKKKTITEICVPYRVFPIRSGNRRALKLINAEIISANPINHFILAWRVMCVSYARECWRARSLSVPPKHKRISVRPAESLAKFQQTVANRRLNKTGLTKRSGK